MLKYQSLKIIVLFIPLIFSFAQNCINYTGGIGELETIFPDASRFFYEQPRELAIGLSDYNTLNSNLKINFNIDKKIKVSGFGSQKITIEKKNLSIITNTPYFQMSIPGANSSEINNSSRSFYPKIGDQILASFNIKTSPKIDNIKYQIRIIGHFFREENPSDNIYATIAAFSTTTPLNEWTTINFSAIINPPNINYQNLNTIFYRIDLSFPSSTASSSGSFWLDKIDFFVKRNNNCLSWPNRSYSSLKMIEVYGIPYIRDFINNYRYNVGHLSSHYTDLIIKNYDNNYKHFFYINLTPLTKNFDPNKKGWTLLSGGEFTRYIDNLKIVDPHGDCSNLKLFVKPNARYPELLKIEKNIPNQYVVHGCVDNAYLGKITNYNDPRIIDKFFEYLPLFDSYFINPNLKYDAIFFDNLSTANNEISKQTPDTMSVKENFLELVNLINKKIGGLFKYFGNWGYLPYINKTNIFDRTNYYLIKDLVNGYLDEGWLLSPYQNDLSFHDPIKTQLIFKTVIENQNYDYIILIGAFPENNCTSTNQKTSYMISSFYLVNNSNVYFALRPISPVEGSKGSYAKPQCYDNSIFLPIGNPLPVQNIEEMIVTSTNNFSDGALYLRKYEKGLILLNSSNNQTFGYQLKGPFRNYLDQLGRVYNTPTIINVPPQSGLILYSNEPSE
ncbi:MAG: hypothetical protein KatS3mg095_0674 [Candidatus Parcubacteria bacterium]|nr:MAG: hypothetical protein KatS3mg095_0674 [Candidatus Parcubacteria bacterium]